MNRTSAAEIRTNAVSPESTGAAPLCASAVPLRHTAVPRKINVITVFLNMNLLTRNPEYNPLSEPGGIVNSICF